MVYKANRASNENPISFQRVIKEHLKRAYKNHIQRESKSVQTKRKSQRGAMGLSELVGSWQRLFTAYARIIGGIQGDDGHKELMNVILS